MGKHKYCIAVTAFRSLHLVAENTSKARQSSQIECSQLRGFDRNKQDNCNELKKQELSLFDFCEISMI